MKKIDASAHIGDSGIALIRRHVSIPECATVCGAFQATGRGDVALDGAVLSGIVPGAGGLRVAGVAICVLDALLGSLVLAVDALA